MPTPGPVAYQVQLGFLTSFVISTGLVHVLPSSSLLQTQTVREPLLFFVSIIAWVSLPRLWVMSIQMVPVRESRTGQGLPHVFSPSAQTTCRPPHDLPPSLERLRTRSILPVSLRPFLRPCQKARRVPFVETSRDGMR